MPEFGEEDLSGSTFDWTDLSGDINGLRINGVDVTSYVEEELAHREPDLAAMDPDDIAGLRAAWGPARGAVGYHRRTGPTPGPGAPARTDRRGVVLHRDAAPRLVRERRVGPPLDRRRAGPVAPARPAVGRAPDDKGFPRDRSARPSLDTVLELRRSRQVEGAG